MADDPNYQEWPEKRRKRRNPPSIAGALIVIAVGVFLLVVNVYPALNAYEIIGRYWPVLLILIGLAKVVESFRYRGAPGDPNPPRQSLAPYAVLVAVALLIFLMVKEGHVEANLHDSHSLDVGAA